MSDPMLPPEPLDHAIAEQAAAWFARMRSGSVSAREKQVFETWLAADSRHRQALQEVRTFWEDGALEQVLNDCETASDIQGTKSSKPAPLFAVWAIAAAVAVVAVLVQPNAWTCFGADYCSGIGERLTLALADGSQVMLNTDTALRVDFLDQERRVALLRGEAYFEVRRDTDRPFVVQAGFSQTRVKGTRFVVRKSPIHDTVTVVSGVVEVARPGFAPATLRENDRVEVDRVQPGKVRQVQAVLAAPWTKGAVLFDSETLEAVVGELGRYRRGAIVFSRDSLKTIKVSGRFNVGDTDKALESLEQTLPIRVRRITPWLVVIS